MARIKITEEQALMLKLIPDTKSKTVLKVTQEQYDRLFGVVEEAKGHPVMGDGSDFKPQTNKENKKTTKAFNPTISEEVDEAMLKADVKNNFIALMKSILANPTQPEITPFWLKKGLDWNKLRPIFMKLGVMKPSGELIDSKTFKTQSKEIISKLYDYIKALDSKNKAISLGDDVEESTTTASVGGQYSTPKIWAKSPSDMRFGKKPAFKGGKIVRKSISEDGKPVKRFAAEFDMYIYADDEQEAIQIGEAITASINKKYDGQARLTQLKEMPWGGKPIQESEMIDNTIAIYERLSVDKHELLISEIALSTGKSIEVVRQTIDNYEKNKINSK